MDHDEGSILPVVMTTGGMRTVTLGLGCFWSPEALFGSMSGVVATRVGYAGGTTESPSYREMGDHSETVEVDFEPDRIGLDELLRAFWRHHNPDNINDYKGRQYRSMALYRDEVQSQTIRRVKHEIEREKGQPLNTEIAPYSIFYPAEERHQKYYLKRYPDAIRRLSSLYPSTKDLDDSTLAARLNGLAKGYTNLEPIRQEIRSWPIPQSDRERIDECIRQIRW
ncbi:peptide-methionine (S)-S-oxide reductase MsrA [Cohnella candidum]|uniref:peptide-methionine (S)-S-oxide reductase MsrA n=1 Tax=Cohnella candidum TaxID=2674991 RepID=UPI001F155FC2|nr:peptide-methionine (S)-S-oxide reductase MsrA [Cohnella candidum]